MLTYCLFAFSCILKVTINNVELALMESALTGANVGPCQGHPCSNDPALTCGDLGGICQPVMEGFTCQCPLFTAGVHCDQPWQQPTGKVSESNNAHHPTIPAFRGNSYLEFHDSEMTKK